MIIYCQISKFCESFQILPGQILITNWSQENLTEIVEIGELTVQRKKIDFQIKSEFPLIFLRMLISYPNNI